MRHLTQDEHHRATLGEQKDAEKEGDSDGRQRELQMLAAVVGAQVGTVLPECVEYGKSSRGAPGEAG